MALDAFKIVNGHPVCGNEMQTIRFEPVDTDAIRIQIAQADGSRAWTIGEIEIYETPLADGP